MLVEEIDRAYNGLQAAIKRKVDTIASREVISLMQLRYFGKLKCGLNSNTQYFDILDKTDLVRIELQA